MGDWMDSYLESKDAEYDSTQEQSVMQQYLAAKDREEAVDDCSVMQRYLDAKDAEAGNG